MDLSCPGNPRPFFKKVPHLSNHHKNIQPHTPRKINGWNLRILFLEEERHFPNHHFQGSMFILGGVFQNMFNLKDHENLSNRSNFSIGPVFERHMQS